MQKNKILSSVLAGILLGITSTSSVKAMDNTVITNAICYSNESVEKLNLEGYENIDIMGTKYDLSNIDPLVNQVVIRVYDRINSGSLSISEKNKNLEEVKNLLNSYIKDPSIAENMAVTLDYGPSTQLREEIAYVQSMIKDLKAQQESIKLTKMVQKAIDEKVQELQNEIDNLKKWINYSIYNFKSDDYKRTFCEEQEVTEDKETDATEAVKFEGKLIDVVYVTEGYNKLFRASIDGNGDIKIEGDKVELTEFTNAVMKNLEFENIKVREILEEIEVVKLSKISKEEQDKRIEELEKKLNDTKFYGVSHEIILLNVEKDNVKNLRLPQQQIDEKVKEIQEEIDERIQELSKYKMNKDYYIESSVGYEPSYFGYVFDDGEGFVVKALLDDDNKVEFQDVENLTAEQKAKLKDMIKKDVDSTSKRINEVVKLKMDLEKKENANKYYLIDSMDKELKVLNNDIRNFENIMFQL